MKAPSFQLYPQDFISSLDCQTMGLEEFGAYNWLLFHSWVQEPQGYLPNNPQILARLLRINPRTFSKMWRNTLEKKFKISECGQFIYNERLISEAEKQANYREKQALNGAKGGRPKKEDNPEKPKPNPSLLDGLNSGKPKKSSSTSSSTSSSLKDIIYPFQGGAFESAWLRWKSYKKGQFKFEFKTKESEQSQLTLLQNMSGNNEAKAIQIIEYTMGQTYRGFVEPKQFTQPSIPFVPKPPKVTEDPFGTPARR